MTQLAAQVNNRKEPRRRTFKGGRIICPVNSTTYDCRIRDMSPGGARLEIDQWFSFPKNVIVEVGRQELISARYECEIRWTNARNLGVQFLRRLPDDNDLKSGTPRVH